MQVRAGKSRKIGKECCSLFWRSFYSLLHSLSLSLR